MPPLLTVGEVAKLLRVTERTITRWADARMIRHVRLPGGGRRFLAEDIAAILTPVELGQPQDGPEHGDD